MQAPCYLSVPYSRPDDGQEGDLEASSVAFSFDLIGQSINTERSVLTTTLTSQLRLELHSRSLPRSIRTLPGRLVIDLNSKTLVGSRTDRVWERVTLKQALNNSSLYDIQKYKERAIAVTQIVLFLRSSPPATLERSRSLKQTLSTSQHPRVNEKIINSFSKP
jgi:hypothetical protein